MNGSKHELKHCPRCHEKFECKAGEVAHCQCKDVQIPEHVYELISKKYDDCLCIKCLQQLTEPLYFNLELHNNFKER